MNFAQAIRALTEKTTSLSEEELFPLAASVVEDSLPLAQSGALLATLALKGESSQEIATFAKAILRRTRRVEVKARPIADICVISKQSSSHDDLVCAAGLLVAACGQRVAQHGSQHGGETLATSTTPATADMLANLGLTLHVPRAAVVESISSLGYGFMHTRTFCSTLTHLTSLLRDMSLPTVFNLAAPIANPAMPEVRVVAVENPSDIERVAQALHTLGIPRGYVFHAPQGQCFSTGENRIALFEAQGVQSFNFSPSDHKLDPTPRSATSGNAETLEKMLHGKVDAATSSQLVFLAGLTLHALGAAQTLAAAFDFARQTLSAGKAHAKFLDVKKVYTSAEVDDDGRTSKSYW